MPYPAPTEIAVRNLRKTHCTVRNSSTALRPATNALQSALRPTSRASVVLIGHSSATSFADAFELRLPRTQRRRAAPRLLSCLPTSLCRPAMSLPRSSSTFKPVLAGQRSALASPQSFIPPTPVPAPPTLSRYPGTQALPLHPALDRYPPPPNAIALSSSSHKSPRTKTRPSVTVVSSARNVYAPPPPLNLRSPLSSLPSCRERRQSARESITLSPPLPGAVWRPKAHVSPLRALPHRRTAGGVPRTRPYTLPPLPKRYRFLLRPSTAWARTMLLRRAMVSGHPSTACPHLPPPLPSAIATGNIRV